MQSQTRVDRRLCMCTLYCSTGSSASLIRQMVMGVSIHAWAFCPQMYVQQAYSIFSAKMNSQTALHPPQSATLATDRIARMPRFSIQSNHVHSCFFYITSSHCTVRLIAYTRAIIWSTSTTFVYIFASCCPENCHYI